MKNYSTSLVAVEVAVEGDYSLLRIQPVDEDSSALVLETVTGVAMDG